MPGQAWASGRTVIHADLKNHPGFLRAAGASAESLDLAVGIPTFHAGLAETLVLIGSDTSPLAQNVSVWIPNGGTLSVQDAAPQVENPDTIPDVVLACADGEEALLGEADHAEIAIPSFADGALSSIALLQF
ncbi:MAG TPA: hypothetical protein DDW52_28160 [Planctomycetaceae bacterium]|nr:hypothetical protein [Planctomycetaceae bacterium]